MSALPILLNVLDELERESYLNDFGLGLAPQLIQSRPHRRRRDLDPLDSIAGPLLPALSLLSDLGERQSLRRTDRNEPAGAVSHIGKDGFQVCMDVAQFKPNELNVKIVDNSIVVEGKHEEREDNHGYISRHFVRRYGLPKGYDADKVQSTLSSDGVLTVSIPKPRLEQKSNERVVQIQQTGPAALNVKANTEEKVGDSAANNGNVEK